MGTSTPVGDITELNAVKNTFGDNIPKISSTKSLSYPLLLLLFMKQSIV